MWPYSEIMGERVGRLLCVGDLNADITITTPDGIAIGSDTAGTVAMAGGGSGANVAAWAARSGVPARFAGVVGADSLGDVLVDELSGDGVEVREVRRVGARSRAIAAVVDGAGERSLVSDLGTATVLAVDDIDTTWFDDVDWLHLTAYTYFPEGGHAVFARLVGIAAARSIPWSVDPSSAEMMRHLEVDDIRRAFDRPAVLFPSRDEAAVISGIDDPTRAAEALLDLAETAVVTCGAAGAVVARQGSAPFVVTSEPGGAVINALGCGDAFAAGFLSGRLDGRDDRACADLATHTAARALALASAR